MSDIATMIHGTVTNGVIVIDTPSALREGDKVVIVKETVAEMAQLARELAAWDRASDEAWALIDDLEKNDRS